MPTEKGARSATPDETLSEADPHSDGTTKIAGLEFANRMLKVKRHSAMTLSEETRLSNQNTTLQDNTSALEGEGSARS